MGERSASDRLVTLGLLTLRLIVLVIAIQVGKTAAPTDDLARFQEIHDAEGLPYRDFVIEYAPLEVVAVRTLLSSDPAVTAGRIALLAFAADIGTWWAIRFAWGRAPAESYLWLGTPLLVFIYTRFDLVPVFLATCGFALAVRRRERIAGASLALAALVQLWPVVVFPGPLMVRRRRAFLWAVASGLVLTAVWWWIAGWRGITDVLSFRHATGWEAESVVGRAVWVGTGGPIRHEAGAPPTRSVPPAAPLGIPPPLAGALMVIWVTASRRRRDAFGGAATSAVAVLLVF